MENNIIDNLKEMTNNFNFPRVNTISSLNLAYIGDAVFEILVRALVISENNSNVDSLHQSSKSFVRAEAQAKMYIAVEPFLTEEEVGILKRGRNAKSYSKAKNADIIDYRHATGIEALFGYLFIKGDMKRLMEIFEICIKSIKRRNS